LILAPHALKATSAYSDKLKTCQQAS